MAPKDATGKLEEVEPHEDSEKEGGYRQRSRTQPCNKISQIVGARDVGRSEQTTKTKKGIMVIGMKCYLRAII